MKVNIKYFGLIAEKIGITSESIELKIDESFDLKQFFENKYPVIKGVKFNVAVNKQISNFINKEDSDVEIALLPPFAGG